MTDMTWKTLRVVVELPVRGDYTTKDLRWDVDRLVGGAKLHRVTQMHGRIETGRIHVKEYHRVVTAEARKK